MSILGNIISKIFGPHAANAAPAPAGAGAGGTVTTAGAGAAPVTPTSTGSQAGTVDVAAILDKKAEEAGQKLNWRSSIVDLMKLVGLDSGLAARKELATELHYTGDQNDSATMNIWLHKQVMAKLAANGGKVPDDLK
jgi:hypothetical protein